MDASRNFETTDENAAFDKNAGKSTECECFRLTPGAEMKRDGKKLPMISVAISDYLGLLFCVI